ncbi:hypothetical protein HDV00_011127 [Rhizophlyctis rosea]|nr:hypothetical protein HDV00_011127 [Rhizophlyctis rosea]
MENQEAQREEIEVLTSIFGDDLTVETTAGELQPTAVSLPIPLAPGLLTVKIHLPTDYPSQSPPFYELLAQGQWEPGDALRERLAEQLSSLFFPGEVVVYSWISFLQEELLSVYGPPIEEAENAEENPTLEDTSSSVSTTSSPATSQPHKIPPADHTFEEEDTDLNIIHAPPGCPPIYTHPDPIIDRKSVFMAHTAPVKTVADVKAVIQALYTNRKIARATHNIYAYRIVESNGVIRQDCEDNGETAAGGRLLHMIQLADLKGVVVVVTRWYGGVHLGPMRFKHINNAARMALEVQGYFDPTSASSKDDKPKAKGKGGGSRR